MANYVGRWHRRAWWLPVLLVILGGYWLLPINGQAVITSGNVPESLVWPRMDLDLSSFTDGQSLVFRVTDVVPWAHVLLTVNGQPAELKNTLVDSEGTWSWEWSLVPQGETNVSDLVGATASFYRDCDTGCIEQSRMVIGGGEGGTPSPTSAVRASPTKLGVVFANPKRDWHGRGGWDLELTYVKPTAGAYWSIDQLAQRVQAETAKGLRVLVRVDYDRGQSIPAPDDMVALGEYLTYVQRLARDERLSGVYGYVIGSGLNVTEGSGTIVGRQVTPAWYARVFNGYGESVAREDNVVQTIRAKNNRVRVLVGPVRPWSSEQNGDKKYTVDVPWLNYMNSLVAALDEGARAKLSSGIALTSPDGFALQTAGRVASSDLAGVNAADEPNVDVRRSEWGNAQAGFGVYRDWLNIINAYSTTRGLPAYLTSVNTYVVDEGTPPSQNYPKGWLTNALRVIDNEPQVQALCWFIDGPLDDRQWDQFSMNRSEGRMLDAAEEFDALLRGDRTK